MSAKENSYGSILKSSSLIGGAQFFNLLIGLVRTKFVAVLIGPAGVGLVGTYMAIQQFAIVLAGLGIGQSGVRDISDARGSDDLERMAETVTVLRRLSLYLGLFGSLNMALLAYPLSRLTFGDDGHALGLLALSVSVCLGLIAAAQQAILQGFRRIGDMAKAGILGTILGSIATIGWYFALGINGIIPAILTMSVISLLFSWYFSRQIEVTNVFVDYKKLINHSKSLLGLGFAFMWNGLMLAALAYVVRLLLLREFDLATVGIYSAAFGISGMIVNFVLQAMGADYFPRLSEVADDSARMSQLVNEQAEVGVLLALPAIVGLVVFAPVLIHVFYTPEFLPAATLIQWFALGCFARVFQWPLGFVLLAKKKSLLFAGSETFFHALHLLFILLGIRYMGLEGVAVAFVSLYFVSFWIILFIVKRLVQFQWNPAAFRLILLNVCIVLGVFVLAQNVKGNLGLILGAVIFCVVSLCCLRGLLVRVGTDHRLIAAVLRCAPRLKNLI